MNKLNLILSIIILILIIALGLVFNKMRDNRDDAIRWEHNYEQSSDTISRINVTLREFKKTSKATNDSLLKALKIKPKQIETIITIHSEYNNVDTTHITLNKVDSTSKTHYFMESIDCVEIGGIVITEYDSEPELIITNISYTNDIDYIAYWKRRQWKFLGIKTRLFGKKLGELEVSSECGNIELHQIDIIKKK